MRTVHRYVACFMLTVLTLFVGLAVPLSAASVASSVSHGPSLLKVGLGFIAFGALSLTDANVCWQKANIALLNANPLIVSTFKALKSYLAQARGNPKLQFIPFTEVQADVAGGTAIADAACTLYGVYTKKENSATDNWFWIYDSATDDTTAAKARVCIPQFIANEQNVFVSPAGIAMATGVLVTQYVTDPLGASDGSTGADGFVIIGA